MYADWPLLSLVIWTPILGGILVLFAGDREPSGARKIALVVSIATFLLTLPLYGQFDTGTHLMQFVERHEWIPAFNIEYYLGIDGISMPLILLTSFTTVIVVISAWEVIQYRASQYMAAFLIMEGFMIGTFSALDSILFYIFFEAMLIPMFLVIGIWGGANRIYATLKFFLYTFIGSVLMLVALIYMYSQSDSFAILDFHHLKPRPDRAGADLPGDAGGLRGQGADVAGAHLVAGRARRGADRRFGDPGGDHVEDRRLRLSCASACRSRPMPAPNSTG